MKSIYQNGIGKNNNSEKSWSPELFVDIDLLLRTSMESRVTCKRGGGVIAREYVLHRIAFS